MCYFRTVARSVDEGGIGLRIGEAREAAGLNQSELAARVAIDRSAVNKIERGTRRVTAFELSEIARALGRRMEWFLTEPTPSIVSHRQRAGTSHRPIDMHLEEITREIEFVASTGGVLALQDYDTKPVPASGKEAENLAEHVRAEVNAMDAPISDLADLAERIGLLAFSRPLGADAADGGSLLLETGGVALINSTADVGRRRITLAHEIGHYVVADEYTVDYSVLQSVNNDRESRMDRFARALLCPATPTQAYWTDQLEAYGDLRAAALKSASHWRVDFATLSRRLVDLGLVDGLQAAEVRSVRAIKADFVELNLFVPTDLESQFLPRSFERAVLALYRAETISAARALELLQDNYEDQDLPVRPINPEATAWQIAW